MNKQMYSRMLMILMVMFTMLLNVSTALADDRTPPPPPPDVQVDENFAESAQTAQVAAPARLGGKTLKPLVKALQRQNPVTAEGTSVSAYQAGMYDGSWKAKSGFATGETVRYLGVVSNTTGVTQDFYAWWYDGSPCGSSWMWSGWLRAPAGNPGWYLETAASCPGTHTFTFWVYYNGNYTSQTTSFTVGNKATYASEWYSQSSYPTLNAGGYADLWVKFKNTGNTTWYNTYSPNRTHLGILDPNTGAVDYVPPFVCTPGWVGNNRPAVLSESSVPPGAVGTFYFRVCAPSNMASGTYRLAVAPLVENVSWMKPSAFVYWDITVRGSAATTPVTYSVDSNVTDRSYVDGITGSALDSAMRAMRSSNNGLLGYGQAIVDVARDLGLNPLYIAGHAALETGWGTSAIWLNKNNPFGYGAFDRCAYTCAYTFASKPDGLRTGMTYIKRDYLVSGGKYYHSQYGPTLRGMNVNYASDQQWKDKIASIMTSLAGKLKLMK